MRFRRGIRLITTVLFTNRGKLATFPATRMAHSTNAANAAHNLQTMDGIRGFLRQFSGGAVTMEMAPRMAGVAMITINNPKKRNAMSGDMIVQLEEHVATLETWSEGQAVILRGVGGIFCSGGDLDFARATGNAEAAHAMNTFIVDALERLSALPIISIAFLEDTTLGGGTEIALACDYILAVPSLQFGVVHGRMGITTAWGGGTRLVQRIGQRKALDLMLTSRILSGAECMQIGIVDEVIPDMNAAHKWLAERLQHDASVTRAMKTICTRAARLSRSESLSAEREIFAPFWGGKLNREALSKCIKHIRKTD